MEHAIPLKEKVLALGISARGANRSPILERFARPNFY